MFKKGYLPINEVTPVPLPPTATPWLVGLTVGMVVAIILSIVLAVVFGVVNANLRNDLNAKLATANTNIATLEMFAMELAEMSGMNTTYEEIFAGRCEMPKGCAADIYSGAFRVLLANTGPFTAMVVEVSPFDTLEAKKKKDNWGLHNIGRAESSHIIAGRVPGQQLTIICQTPGGLVGPPAFRDLLRTDSDPDGYLILTPGQLASLNLTGPNIGNGAGQTKSNPNYQFQTAFFGFGSTALTFNFNWYPDYVPCAGDVFDLLAPTKFTIGAVISTIGSSKKKRDIVPGPVQRERVKKSVH